MADLRDIRCPLHPKSRVWRDGYYGRKEPGHFQRQRYKCVRPNGKRHVFTEELPRRVAHLEECDVCERPTPSWAGARTPRRYQFSFWEIAHALTLVGAGGSYRATSAALRRQIGRSQSKSDIMFSRDAHLVQDWVEVFAPIIERAFVELSWPEVLVVDEVGFAVKRARAPRSWQRFVVMGAMGHASHRMIRLAAYPDRSSTSWRAFFKYHPGRPERIVCDGSLAIRAAIEHCWPAPHTPAIWISHHHLVSQIKEKLPLGSPLIGTATTALWSIDHWHDFLLAARACPVPQLHDWIEFNNELVTRQITARIHPLSTGGLEEKLRTIKGWLEDRRGTLSNQQRLDRLLMLMRIQLNGLANRRTYHRVLVSHFQNGGPVPPTRWIPDPEGYASLW